MKTRDQDMARRGANNTREEQEDVASGDHAKQRKVGVREFQEKARKDKQKSEQKKSDK
jgi:hypothetical protein